MSTTAAGTLRGPLSGVPADAPPAWRRPLLVAAGLTAATALVAALDPRRTHLVPPCPFRAATGLDCPLCGGTRAVHDLVHLDVAAAAGQHLLVVALAPLVAVAVLAWLISALRPARWPRLRARLPRAATIAAWVGLAFVVFGVLRVLPVDSLRWLRSG